MVYIGYLELGGVEIVNAARAAAYVHYLMPQLQLTDCTDCPDLAAALGDPEYRTPMLDSAPWFDPDQPETGEFLGVYPLSIEGIADSVRSATVTELTDDGGVVGTIRHTSREMRVTALLIASTQAGIERGMVWFRYAALGNPCRDPATGCEGDDLCYFASCPEFCEDSPDFTSVEDCTFPYRRRFRQVTITDGPRIVEEYNLSCGAMYRVEFTMVAGVPWPYTDPIPVDLSAMVRDAVIECTGTPPPDPTVDPACPQPPSPPRPPQVLNPCLVQGATYTRDAITVPNEAIPLWGTAVPILTLQTALLDVNQTRIRFYMNPLQLPLGDIDPCGYCGEFLVSYIPKQSVMVIDGSLKQAIIRNARSTVEHPATHLLYGDDGGPMMWPELTCGVGYTMTLDFTPGDTPARAYPDAFRVTPGLSGSNGVTYSVGEIGTHPTWTADDGDTNYIRLRPGSSVASGDLRVPVGLPLDWFAAPRIAIRARATTSWTDMTLRVRLADNSFTHYTNWASYTGGTNHYDEQVLAPTLAVGTAADLQAAAEAGTLWIVCEAGGGTGDISTSGEVRITYAAVSANIGDAGFVDAQMALVIRE